jgi:hypothetical protein
MAAQGWKQLLGDLDRFRAPRRFPIQAYSEFMPPPRLGCKPYGWVDPSLFSEEDPWGWQVSEFEEAYELQPGMELLAQEILRSLVALGSANPAHGLARNKLADNPYWPFALVNAAGKLQHERYVTLLPMALSKTQDDKGRVRWTLMGTSEQGPARAFWRGFFSGPRQEVPAEEALTFFRELLKTVYGESEATVADLHAAGFRILPQDAKAKSAVAWDDGPLPSWTKQFVLQPSDPIAQVKYLLTFRPFGELPPEVRHAYLAGELHLLPFPGSLLFWGIASYLKMRSELTFAAQIPLLHVVARHGDPYGIRVPQSGWIHEPREGKPAPEPHLGPYRNTYRRTHRWQKIHRDETVTAELAHEDKLAHVLFSTQPEDIGLYGKPMARNVQLWTHKFAVLLDGPSAKRSDLQRAFDAISQGGTFGYRFQWPPMQVGLHQVYWQRPLCAYWSEAEKRACLLDHAPLGYLTAYSVSKPRLDKPVELWPRLLARPEYLAAIKLHPAAEKKSVRGKVPARIVHDHRPHATARNARSLMQTQQLQGGEPLEPSFARSLLALAKAESLEDWLTSIPKQAADAPLATELAEHLRSTIAPPPKRSAKKPEPSLTYRFTSQRKFEVDYWNMISALSTGQYVNKDNADCVRDPVTQALLTHPHRDLEALGDYVLDYYRGVVKQAGMTRTALVGDLPFKWQTDFDFAWSGGWLENHRKKTEERDLICVIPGRDRKRAVIMADHYDTAYMENVYEKERGGSGARLSAAGADDNHSATAALMLAAPVFLEMSKAGKLDCDIWLVHLTGEEFPSDCMGARAICQQIVEGTLKIRLGKDRWRDLSKVQIQGVYVSDMIAHNKDHDQDVFQIAPGTSDASLWLAYQAHRATESWNQGAAVWNERPARRGRPRGKRCTDGHTIPETARHPTLSGEVRLPYNPRSTLYNTDGQIFSDAGVPVVLFMENYDINRQGYHDTHDTLENIDLDYGAAVAAIVIESVARAATEKRG